MDSADVNLKSASFRQFAKQRDEWELNDHYESPGPIQYYGENSNYVPLSLSLEEKYDYMLIDKIEKELNQLKSINKFGVENKQLRIIETSLASLLTTLQIIG